MKDKTNKPPKVMIVEDEVLSAVVLKNALEKEGYEVSELVTKGEAAVRQALATPPDVILMDIYLSNHITGIEATRRIQSQQDIPVLYISAYTDDDTMNRTRETDNIGFVAKPFEIEDVTSILDDYFVNQ